MMFDRKPMADISSFNMLDIRVGTIREASNFDKAKKPAIKLLIDFGLLGILTSSAQITKRYKPEMLIGKQVVAIVNFPPRLIAGFQSECLVLGVTDEQGDVVLVSPEQPAINGLPLA
jgi:tRNA-binding protein